MEAKCRHLTQNQEFCKTTLTEVLVMDRYSLCLVSTFE